MRANGVGLFFFFQAEDGIRDLYVTGVQTCALPISVFARRRSAPRCSSRAPVCSRYALNTAMACRTSSGSVVARALEKPPAALPKSLGLGGKSLRAALSGPNNTRQRGAACTNTGSMKAASIIADVHRPLAMSHAKTPSASAASATNAQRPELMIARGSALRIQPPILTADTNKESASVAYATTVKSMADRPLGPSMHPRRRFGFAPTSNRFFRKMPAELAFVYSLTAPVIAET